MIGGHAKAVSYVRWMGGNALVSASTDNALKVWDVARGCAADARTHAWQPATTLTGEALLFCLAELVLSEPEHLSEASLGFKGLLVESSFCTSSPCQVIDIEVDAEGKRPARWLMCLSAGC